MATRSNEKKGGGSLNGRPNFGVPPGVIEHIGMGTDGGIVELRDGTLMLAQGGGIPESGSGTGTFRTSKDGGEHWDAPQSLPCEIGVGGMIRLHSGLLAIYSGTGPDLYFSSSKDEGKTWRSPVHIPAYPDFRPMFHSMIQLSSGRLLVTGYWESNALNGAHPDLEPVTATRWGWWRGCKLLMEGHRNVEMGICLVYYSDDEGTSWKKCEGGLMGWFNSEGIPDGTGGITDVYEPTLAETNDGRVLLFARCKRGRLAQSYSLDGGQTWYSMQPTELASSQSPPLLVRIPPNGDLLCVWNQASGEEIRRGYLRGRLSSAISQDSGMTWGHFKTLELQEGLEDAARIRPEFPIPAIVRGRFGLGQLVDGFAMFTYPNVDIVGETVFIRYSRMWPQKRGTEATMTGEAVMRLYPLRWFYE